MPVLVTNEFPPPGHGGIERYMVRLAEELTSMNYNPVVVAPAVPDCGAFDRRLPYRVIRFPYVPSDAVPLVIARIAAATVQAHRESATRQTIAASWIRSGIACALLPKGVRGRLAIIAHGSEVLSQKHPVKKTMMRRTFALADVIVANSVFTANILAGAGVARAPIIARCGVESRPLVRAPAPDPTILSVGRLVPRKGFDRTIEAVALLSPRFPALRYEIAGSGPDEERLRALASNLAVEDRVRFLGSVSDAELSQAYARAWCFSLPTRRVGEDVEGFGIVYLEAAMAALPAIGGKGSGAQEAIEDERSGVVVDGEDAPEIARVLEALLVDRKRAAEMGAYARERALTHFTWRSAAQTIMDGLEPNQKPARTPEQDRERARA